MKRGCPTGQQPACGQSNTQSQPNPSGSNTADDPNSENSLLLLTKPALGERLSETAYDLNVHLAPEDDRIGRGHRRAVDDHPDAMARLSGVSEDLLGIEGLPPNPEEFAEGVLPRNAGLHMDRTRSVMCMEGRHPTHPIRHIGHRGVLVQRMVLPEARVDADVRGDRRGLTVNRDCQERMRVEGPPPVDR